MITRLRVRNFRLFAGFEIEPGDGLNVLVGDNEAGKSTILHALTLALTGRSNGKWASDEITPDWFHLPAVNSFFDQREQDGDVELPEIEAEVYLDDPDDSLQRYRGVHNGLGEDAVGLRLHANARAGEPGRSRWTRLGRTVPRVRSSHTMTQAE